MTEEQKQRSTKHDISSEKENGQLHSTLSEELESDKAPNKTGSLQSEKSSGPPSRVNTSDQEEKQEAVNDSAISSSEQAVAAFQKEIAALRTQLERQTQQTDAFKAQYIRCAADFDNFRKRMEKAKEELEHRMKGETITELLQVIDNFERARLQIKPETDEEMEIHKSYQGVYRQLVDALKRVGVSAMRPEGQQFDPNFHEAVCREQTDEYPEGTVIEQLQRGYLLGDRVLRHAMVKVAATLEAVVSSEEESASAQEADLES